MFIKCENCCYAVNSDYVFSVALQKGGKLVANFSLSATGEEGEVETTIKENATQKDFHKLLKALNKKTA